MRTFVTGHAGVPTARFRSLSIRGLATRWQRSTGDAYRTGGLGRLEAESKVKNFGHQMTERFSLVVSQESEGDRYYFFPQNGAPLDGGKTTSIDMDNMDDFVGSSYYTTLREATDGTLSDGRVRTHLRNLKGLGNQLYKDVIPSQLKGAVERMNKGDLLHIFTDKPRIPWELVKNGGDFWGQLYIMSNSMMTG